ncbi:TlpA family protein disulfide reductase [Flavobacterium okayamense]|uniref:Thioredoxin domain-containing protein n=1 Tax=Flavobacterium okayamense TaxID=2830782 RepID=A0ABM7SB00_9FLAO|nr:TlpA disulfide reductase family protein [Flavobacterium okayamense]BCY28464.1 hypothetical protein KK2020170_13320 [Flavobacterium okayamense]
MIHIRLKYTKFYLILFLFPIFTFSQNQIEIPLEHIYGDKNDIFNVRLLHQHYRLTAISEIPSLNELIKKEFKGIPNNNNISFYFKTENTLKLREFIYQLYRENRIRKSEFYNYIQNNYIDTLRLQKTKTDFSDFCLILLKKDKNEFKLLADVDRDKNFKNNVTQKFNLNFEKDQPLKTTKILNYSYNTQNQVTFKRNIFFYPETQQFDNYTETVIHNNFTDFWKGKTLIDNKELTFYYQGISSERGAFFFKPNNISFEDKDIWFKSKFEKYRGDTLIFNKNILKIDSISSDLKNIYITKIKTLEKNYSNYPGSFIRDFYLVDFENKKTKLHEVLKEKKYTLLDFWASWCGPCIEKFPEIEELQNLHSDKLTVIGLSTENDFQKAKKAVEKYNLSWRNFQGMTISNQLDIHSIPSLFLIDENGKIISRDDIEEIKRILDN